METKHCQSCGMPMTGGHAQYGHEKDGSLSPDYCSFCYENGAFLGNPTMEQMIDFCVPYMQKASPDLSETEIRQEMLRFFPTLKRWKEAAK